MLKTLDILIDRFKERYPGKEDLIYKAVIACSFGAAILGSTIWWKEITKEKDDAKRSGEISREAGLQKESGRAAEILRARSSSTNHSEVVARSK